MTAKNRFFIIKASSIVVILFIAYNFSFSQCFITGADLSYVNKIEEKGGLYRNAEGNLNDPYVLFAEKGAKMIRLRLWHTPENNNDYCGNPINASSLNDVLNAAQKIKENGMSLNISIHYSDNFADPSKQLMPAKWATLSHQLLLDSIYQYTYKVLDKLYVQNTVPEIVSVGNETTWGFIDSTTPTNGFTWPDDAQKFNAAFNAIDDFNQQNSQSVKKAIHFTESSAEWAANLFKNSGIINYDIIGISYYPANSPTKSLLNIAQMMNRLKTTYNCEVMIFETGFVWTTSWADNYGNFMNNNGSTLTYPISAQGQKSFLIDLSTVVYENGGIGVLYWEPAWISSEMCDRWGKGSSYENASFFDFANGNSALPAFDFLSFCKPLATNELIKADEVTIFPNPVQNISIQISTDVSLHSWKIVNLKGQLISTGVFNNYQKSQTIAHQIKAKGVYYLQLMSTDKRIISKKLIFY